MENPPRLVVSPRLLLVSVLAALAIAVTLLLLVVLPAAHGVDPIGAGAVLGTLRIEPPVAAPREIEQVLAVGEGRTLPYAFEAPGGYRVEIAWNATAPVTGTLAVEPPPAGGGVEGVNWSQATTLGATAVTVATDSLVHMEWTNPGAEPVTIVLDVRFIPLVNP